MKASARTEWDRNYRERHPDRVKASRLKFNLARPDSALASNRKWRSENIELHRTRCREYMAKNKEQRKDYYKVWELLNKDIRRANIRRYQARKIMAMPKWLSEDMLNDIQSFYTRAISKEAQDGIPYHVDHIIPLGSKTVCGLHVPWNLQVLPSIQNQIKGARYAT